MKRWSGFSDDHRTFVCREQTLPADHARPAGRDLTFTNSKRDSRQQFPGSLPCHNRAERLYSFFEIINWNKENITILRNTSLFYLIEVFVTTFVYSKESVSSVSSTCLYYHFTCKLQSYYLTMFLGVAIMLSITIFATIVGDMLPVSDSTPLIGQQHTSQRTYYVYDIYRQELEI